jgi:serine beta-lactamase-like protein LACTB
MIMHSRHRYVRLALFATLLATGIKPVVLAGQAPVWVDAPSPVRYTAAVDSARKLIRAMMAAPNAAPGSSAAVAVNGEIVWSEGFGFADLENRVLVSPLTRFRVGSISKAMTGVAIGLLVERGSLDLDAPLQRYVPSFPEKTDIITPRMLGGHLSGIRHYKPGSSEFFNTKHYKDVTESLEIFKDDPLLFKPGTKYSYTSYGFNVLAAVVEAASGADFLTYTRKNVFAPLGMRNTVADFSDSIIPYRTRFYVRPGQKQDYSVEPYHWGDGTLRAPVNAAPTDNSNKWAGGGFLSTPEDLVRFGSAVMQPGFLQPKTMQLLFTSQRTPDGKDTGYGIGWNIGTDREGRRRVGHGGGSVGGTSSLIVYPNEKVVVAMQANITNGQLGGLPEAIAGLFINSPDRTARVTGATP